MSTNDRTRPTTDEPTTNDERPNELGRAEIERAYRDDREAPPGGGGTHAGGESAPTLGLPLISPANPPLSESPGQPDAKAIARAIRARTRTTPTPAPRVTPQSDHPKQNRTLPKSAIKRSTSRPDAPLPFFRKPDILPEQPGQLLEPHELRKSAGPGDNRKRDRRSRSQVAAERLAEETRLQALVPQADQIPQAIEVNQAWEIIKRTYRDNPEGFVRDLLLAEPDPWQCLALSSISESNQGRVSIRAGHGVGKTAYTAFLIIWHIVCHFPQKTIISSPSEGQLKNAIFPEIKKWMYKLPEEILSLFELQVDRILLKGHEHESFVSARTCSKENAQSFAGVHCEDGSVLMVFDEASVIPEEVYEVASGSMSGPVCHMVLISNPTKNSGRFYNTHHKLSKDAKIPVASAWNTIHVSSLDVPRATHHAQDFRDEYGLNSNAYRVRVLGEFPSQEDDVLIPAWVVDAATKRDVSVDPQAPLIFGVDLARFGEDRSVLIKRRGNVVLDAIAWEGIDLMQSAYRIKAEADKDNPAEICIDSNGLGAGTADRLRELGYPVYDVNVSERTSMNEGARYLRDDLWLQVRDWLKTLTVFLPPIDRLLEDLKTPTYSFDDKDKLVVESKKMMRKRHLPSPDYADALCMSFAGMACLIGGRAPLWSSRKKSVRRHLPGIV